MEKKYEFIIGEDDSTVTNGDLPPFVEGSAGYELQEYCKAMKPMHLLPILDISKKCKHARETLYKVARDSRLAKYRYVKNATTVLWGNEDTVKKAKEVQL